jgi:hypothetical protein
MAQDQQFDVLGAAITGELGQHLQHLAQQQVYQRRAHDSAACRRRNVGLAQTRTSGDELCLRAPQAERVF